VLQLIFVWLFTYSVTNDRDDLWVLLILLVYNVFFFLHELPIIWLLRFRYIADIGHVLDIVKITMTFIYLFSKLTGNVVDSDEDEQFIAALAILFNWLRLMGFLRAFSSLRFYIRIILEITRRSIPFLFIFILFVIAVAYCLMALRDSDEFEEYWQLSYRLAYGDFEEEYPGHKERTIFLVATILMPLIMLNLLIAIMGDIFSTIIDNAVVADTQERLWWLVENAVFSACYRKARFKMLHMVTIHRGDEAEEEWEGQMRALKRDFRHKVGKLSE
jgi:hypothetical protein